MNLDASLDNSIDSSVLLNVLKVLNYNILFLSLKDCHNTFFIIIVLYIFLANDTRTTQL